MEREGEIPKTFTKLSELLNSISCIGKKRSKERTTEENKRTVYPSDIYIPELRTKNERTMNGVFTYC